jgi:hypothetical protein
MKTSNLTIHVNVSILGYYAASASEWLEQTYKVKKGIGGNDYSSNPRVRQKSKVPLYLTS